MVKIDFLDYFRAMCVSASLRQKMRICAQKGNINFFDRWPKIPKLASTRKNSILRTMECNDKSTRTQKIKNLKIDIILIA